MSIVLCGLLSSYIDCLPLRPIPGATAKGRLANRPVMSVANALESAVLVVTSWIGRPAPWRIWGLMTWGEVT